jgi:hypothetical protein
MLRARAAGLARREEGERTVLGAPAVAIPNETPDCNRNNFTRRHGAE